MKVKPETPHRFEHEGKVWGFWRRSLRGAFPRGPREVSCTVRRVRSRATPPAPAHAHCIRLALHRPAPRRTALASQGSTYTCPMDPEVRQDHRRPARSAAWPSSRTCARRRRRTEWTCPMHPEIVRDAPGSCPICGMALEPRTVTLDEDENPELRRHDAALLGLAPRSPCRSCRSRWRDMLPGTARRGIALAATCARGSSSRSRRRSCCGAAGRSSSAAGASVVNRSLNMFTLIALGVGVAFVYSVVARSLPGALPARVPRHDGAGRASTSRRRP